MSLKHSCTLVLDAVTDHFMLKNINANLLFTKRLFTKWENNNVPKHSKSLFCEMPLNGEQTVMHNDNNALPVEIMSSLCHLKYNLSVSLLSPICSVIGYECEHALKKKYCLIPFLLTSRAVSKRKALERDYHPQRLQRNTDQFTKILHHINVLA